MFVLGLRLGDLRLVLQGTQQLEVGLVPKEQSLSEVTGVWGGWRVRGTA